MLFSCSFLETTQRTDVCEASGSRFAETSLTICPEGATMDETLVRLTQRAIETAIVFIRSHRVYLKAAHNAEKPSTKLKEAAE